MRKQKTKLILIIIVILIIIIFLFRIQKNQNFNIQEELIFFKLFSSHPEENSSTFLEQENVSYDFQVAYQNIDFKDIYLADTIKQNTLVQEKIAPGTEGDFSILLQSNKKVNYRIQFKSTNEKPQNLYFQMKGSDKKYKNLEDMEEKLQGELLGNKRITIHWKWEYEGKKEENLQDTKDGQTIAKYQFTIFAIGQ